MRKELNINDEAIIYGRYGGYNQFDIEYVKSTILKAKSNVIK